MFTKKTFYCSILFSILLVRCKGTDNSLITKLFCHLFLKNTQKSHLLWFIYPKMAICWTKEPNGRIFSLLANFSLILTSIYVYVPKLFILPNEYSKTFIKRMRGLSFSLKRNPFLVIIGLIIKTYYESLDSSITLLW